MDPLQYSSPTRNDAAQSVLSSWQAEKKRQEEALLNSGLIFVSGCLFGGLSMLSSWIPIIHTLLVFGALLLILAAPVYFLTSRKAARPKEKISENAQVLLGIKKSRGFVPASASPVPSTPINNSGVANTPKSDANSNTPQRTKRRDIASDVTVRNFLSSRTESSDQWRLNSSQGYGSPMGNYHQPREGSPFASPQLNSSFAATSPQALSPHSPASTSFNFAYNSFDNFFAPNRENDYFDLKVYHPSPVSIEKNAKDSSEEFSNQRNYVQVQQLMERLNIVQYIDDWVERMRIWFQCYLLQPLAFRMSIAEKFQMDLVDAPNLALWQNSTQTSMFAKPTSTSFTTSLKPTTLWGAPQQTNNNDNEKIQLRMTLEKYLSITEPSTNQRKLLIQRINTLADKFRNYNGAEIQKEKALPPDCQILLHLFATFIDSHTTNGTFARYQNSAEKPDQKKLSPNEILIYPRRSVPLHYELLVSGEVWPVPAGRDNLFYVLVLWIFAMKKYKQGFFPGGISLGVPRLDLLSIIAN